MTRENSHLNRRNLKNHEMVKTIVEMESLTAPIFTDETKNVTKNNK